MATQIFMELEGIDGTTSDPDKDYAGYFDVMSFSMGGEFNFAPSTFTVSGGAVCNPVRVQIKHTKNLASIYQYWQQRTKTKAKLVWRQVENKEATKAIKLVLTDAFIVAVDSSVTDNDGTDVDAVNSLTLTFKTFEIETATAKDGVGGLYTFDIMS